MAGGAPLLIFVSPTCSNPTKLGETEEVVTAKSRVGRRLHVNRVVSRWFIVEPRSALFRCGLGGLWAAATSRAFNMLIHEVCTEGAKPVSGGTTRISTSCMSARVMREGAGQWGSQPDAGYIGCGCAGSVTLGRRDYLPRRRSSRRRPRAMSAEWAAALCALLRR